MNVQRFSDHSDRRYALRERVLLTNQHSIGLGLKGKCKGGKSCQFCCPVKGVLVNADGYVDRRENMGISSEDWDERQRADRSYLDPGAGFSLGMVIFAKQVAISSASDQGERMRKDTQCEDQCVNTMVFVASAGSDICLSLCDIHHNRGDRGLNERGLSYLLPLPPRKTSIGS